MVLNIVFYKLSISHVCYYQVHRIDAQYGKQTHSSALRRSSGLALASPSKQSDIGLNFAREELADAALHGDASFSNVVTELSGAPSSMDSDGSMLITASTPPDAPPSVAKPHVPQGLKIREPTYVQKALQASTLPAQSQEFGGHLIHCLHLLVQSQLLMQLIQLQRFLLHLQALMRPTRLHQRMGASAKVQADGSGKKA